MKIVVAATRGIPNILGGVETYCEELFPRIAQSGVNVTIICRKSYVNDSLSDYKRIRLVDLATSKKKSFEAIVHTKPFLKQKNYMPILYISMLSGLLY